MIRIKLGRAEAVIEDYEARSDDEIFARFINSFRDPAGPPTSWPDKDRAFAEQLIQEIGVEIIEEDDPPEWVPGRVY